MNTLVDTSSPARWLEARCTDGLQVWALVDGSAAPSHRKRWRGFQEINLFSRISSDPQVLEIAPRLLAAGVDERRFLACYEEQSAEQCCASLVATPLNLAELATRLERRIHVDAAGLPMILRFWDPRVLRVLPRALACETLSALLAFGVQALVPDRTGGHQTVDLACPAEDPLAHCKVKLVPEELDALQQAAHPDTLLGALREQDGMLLDTVPDDHRYTLAARQWQACEARQFRSLPDQVLALGLAIEHGEDWWAQPRWHELVQRATGNSLLAAYLALTNTVRNKAETA